MSSVWSQVSEGMRSSYYDAARGLPYNAGNKKDEAEHAPENRLNPTKTIDLEKIYAILAEIDALPVLGNRTEDEILGYDEFGIPR